ncbi:hypothetical protein FRX31_019224 [Thalictrum thalictroides]|uniref:Uncharacterized protein n=1 Tax=Thalictrum thalictroides TaxID=46969 RepID=A0A7J6W3V6_THATH|nr:hypothetical protein FRX31_019224 [Thalictrum thalictroides]
MLHQLSNKDCRKSKCKFQENNLRAQKLASTQLSFKMAKMMVKVSERIRDDGINVKIVESEFFRINCLVGDFEAFDRRFLGGDEVENNVGSFAFKTIKVPHSTTSFQIDNLVMFLGDTTFSLKFPNVAMIDIDEEKFFKTMI